MRFNLLARCGFCLVVFSRAALAWAQAELEPQATPPPFFAPSESGPAPAEAPAPVTAIPARLIEGRVFSVDGVPLAGAEVFVQIKADPFTKVDGPLTATVRTAGDGSFKTDVRLPRDRAFRVAVRPSGAPAFASEPMTAQTPLPLRLTAPARGGWIAGRVLNAEGRPLGHGRVDLFSMANQPWIRVARAAVAPDGAFLLGPVAEDTYSLTHELYERDTELKRISGIKASAREEAEASPVVVRSPHGRVDYFTFRAADPDGRPVEQYRLDVEGRTRDGKPFHYGADVAPSAAKPGAHEVFDAAPGEYLALARTENASVLAAFRDESTTAGEHAAIPLVLRPRRPVTVNVVNSDGSPGAGAEVVIYGNTHPKPPELALPLNFRARADGRGQVACGCLWAGKFNACVAADADHENTFAQFEARDDAPTSLTIRRKGKPGETVGGQVVDAAGRPLAGAEVRLSYSGCWMPGSETFLGPGQVTMRAVTGPDGRWRTRLIPCPFPMVKEKVFDLHVHHPDAGDASFYMAGLGELLAKPVTVPPPGGVTLEFAPENPSDAFAVTHTWFLIRFLRGGAPVYSCLLGGLPGGGMVQLNHEIPPLERGVPLRVEAFGGGWVCGEPVLVEEGREVGKGEFTLPAEGRAKFIVRLPLRPAGSSSLSTRGFPLRLHFTDAETGAPAAGVVARDMIPEGDAGASGEDGTLTANLCFWDGCIHLASPWRPVASSLGEVIDFGGNWSRIKLPEGAMYPTRQGIVEVKVKNTPPPWAGSMKK